MNVLFMQVFDFIDNDKMWKIEKIIDKIKNKKGV